MLVSIYVIIHVCMYDYNSQVSFMLSNIQNIITNREMDATYAIDYLFSLS
jgi:hypothetical protein